MELKLPAFTLTKRTLRKRPFFYHGERILCTKLRIYNIIGMKGMN